LNFNFENMQVEIGEEVDVFALDYSTNVHNFDNVFISSTDERVVETSNSGQIKAIGFGNCKIVVNVVFKNEFISDSFDIFVVDNNVDIEHNNNDTQQGDGLSEDSDSQIGIMLRVECVKESANFYILSIYKNDEVYYGFDFEFLSGEDDLIEKTKYGNCIELNVVKTDNMSIRIFDLNSSADVIFDNFW